MKPLVPEKQAQGVVEIVGDDVQALLDFYLAFGFELERRTGDFAVVHWQGTRLFLAQHPAAHARTCWGNIRILVDDVDRLWQLAHALRFPIASPLEDRFYGVRDFTVVDPAGFGLRFAQALIPCNSF